jgi:hypothetical protein
MAALRDGQSWIHCKLLFHIILNHFTTTNLPFAVPSSASNL